MLIRGMVMLAVGTIALGAMGQPIELSSWSSIDSRGEYPSDPVIQASALRGANVLYNNTAPCTGNFDFADHVSTMPQLAMAGFTQRKGVPLQLPISLQDSGFTNGGFVEGFSFRYVVDIAQPLDPVNLKIWQGTSMELNDIGVPVMELTIAGLPGDANTNDTFLGAWEVFVNLADGTALAQEIFFGQQLLLTLDDARPFPLDPGQFGFSFSTATNANVFGPALATNGLGNVNQIRLLDSFDRMPVPEGRFNFTNSPCLVSPYAGIYLLLFTNDPAPVPLHIEQFDTAAVDPAYAPLGSPDVFETLDNRLHVLPAPGTPGGFAFTLDTPTTSDLCSVFAGMEIPASGDGDFLEMRVLVMDVGPVARGPAVATAEATARVVEKSSPNRLNVIITDKNGKKKMFTIAGKKLSDIDSKWFDRVGNMRQFEIRYKDGTKWNSPLVDPPGSQTIAMEFESSVEFFIDFHEIDDAHRQREPTTLSKAVLSDLQLDVTNGELDADFLVGNDALDFDLPQQLHLVGITDGVVIGSTPLVGPPNNNVQFVDEAWLLHFSNAPILDPDGLPPQHLLLTGVLPDGSRYQAATPSVVDPDPIQTMVDCGLMFPGALNISMAGSGPHAADGVDTAFVVMGVTDRATGLPVNGLDIEVLVQAGIDENVEAFATSLGGGEYEFSYSSTISGLHDVVAQVPSRDARSNITIEFTPDAQITELVIDFLDSPLGIPKGVADGISPVSVVISAQDQFGNVIPFQDPITDLSVTTSLVSTPSLLDDGEILLELTSADHGLFSVDVIEVANGVSGSFQVVFPVVCADPTDLIQPEQDAGPTTLRLPMSVVVQGDWTPTTITVNLLGDTGLTALGDVVGVADPDPNDNFAVTGSVISGGGLGTEVMIEVEIVPLSLTGLTQVAPFEIVLDTGPQPVAHRQVEGLLTVESLISDTVHPEFGTTSVPVSPDTIAPLRIYCWNKCWWEGCIIYINAEVPDNKAQVTNRQLCQAHGLINQVWAQACISFEKKLCDIEISGSLNDAKSPGGTQVSSAIPKNNSVYSKLNQAAADAADACGFTIGKCLLYVHVQAQTGLRGTTRASGISGRNVTVNKTWRNSRTSPHEVGHCLGLGHGNFGAGGGDNCMTPTNSANANNNTNLTAMQITKARSSGFVNKKVKRFYFIFPIEFSDATVSPDGDSDGVDDALDNCPDTTGPQGDSDNDGWGDVCDNCPADFNPDQSDCDGDGIGDLCAIMNGQVQDCNDNGVPDSCDIAFGTSFDIDNNGRPDECPDVLCACDWNVDSTLNSDDFFGFLNDFFAGNADFNEDGVTNSDDFFSFLNCFFSPPPECVDAV